MTTERWMVVGLGNPGKRYARNRHNIGFMVVDHLSSVQTGFDWRPSQRFMAEIAFGKSNNIPVVLVKPQTYMNLSGQSVSQISRFYRIEPNQILAIHDDVDLELGRLKIKKGGGDGGHKGIQSLSQELGTNEFGRIRFGIDRPARGDVADFVLHDFYPEQVEQLEKNISRAVQAVMVVMELGFKEAMNRFNGPIKEKEEGNKKE